MYRVDLASSLQTNTRTGVKRAVRHVSAPALNQRVACKDRADKNWRFGVVTSLSPLAVKCDGLSRPFSWD